MYDANEFNVLVLGMGASAYGRERRAVQSVTSMRRISPFFLISKWEDGSVSRLLREFGLEYGYAPFGYLGRARPHWTLVTFLHLPLLLARVIRTCRRTRSRAILFLSVTPFINALPAILYLRFIRRIPLVFYFGDVPARNRALRLTARLMRACSLRFVVNSEAVRRGLVRLGIPDDSIRTVYNGVDLDRFRTRRLSDFRDRYGWPRQAMLAAYAGQLNPRKGVEDFLAAAALTVREDDLCRFLLFGRLDPSNAYHRLLLDRVTSLGLSGQVRFTGWIPRIEEALGAVDVLVVPSRYEDAAPNVVLEAMASGKPVMGAKAGGIPELVRDGETGFLFQHGRPDEIASGLQRLARQPDLRRRLGREARRWCRRRFDLARNARQVEEVLLHA